MIEPSYMKKWLLEVLFKFLFITKIKEAGARGYVDIIQYIYSNSTRKPSLWHYVVPEATKNGHLDIIQFLCDHVTLPKKILFDSLMVCDVEIFDFLYKKFFCSSFSDDTHDMKSLLQSIQMQLPYRRYPKENAEELVLYLESIMESKKLPQMVA